jgi:Xaa-Pro aminopeptidase
MVTAQEFKKRRQKLLNQVGSEGAALVVSASECKRNGDVEFPFRQDSDFYYLTGFCEPDAVALFLPGRTEGEYILFNRERDPASECWVGARAGQEGACKIYGADQAFAITVLDEKIVGILDGRGKLYFTIGKDSDWDKRVAAWTAKIRAKHRQDVKALDELIDIRSILHEMRLRKSPSEIALLRRAAEISAAAHRRAIRTCSPGMFEYELEAELLYEFTRQGSRASAYPTIVGGGGNGCVLHYVTNDAQLVDGELVLVDAGAEYQYYAADITRTYPINGRFTPEQAAVYELVLKTQQAVIDKIKPGVVWNELQQTAIEHISAGLLQLGILSGTLDELLTKRTYQQYYMHNIGHWLGLDVHDVGSYKVDGKSRVLESGMVLTVEPGIYLAANESLSKNWWNIAVRIEDDVLVTDKGCEVLTKDVPKSILEIESLIAKTR